MKRFVLTAFAAGAVLCAQPAQKSDNKATQKQTQVKEETTPQKDPVCGMTIEPKTADGKYAYNGKMYYFCSRDDMETFKKDPAKYAKK
ncbi:MAG TPA: YHS domain-containing protein [Bryobacteraceae bacterium]|nr:YHS domain-containing protein [Bryobacteraceae bacterium]